MAVTTVESTQYAEVYSTNPPTLQRPADWGGVERVAYFSQTATGAGDTGSSIALVKLPPGKVRLLLPSSQIQSTMSGAVDIGWDAYTNVDGTAVAADADGLIDGQSLETGVLAPMGTNMLNADAQAFGTGIVATGGTKLFDSKDGVTLRLTFQGAGVASSDVTSGYFTYIDV